MGDSDELLLRYEGRLVDALQPQGGDALAVGSSVDWERIYTIALSAMTSTPPGAQRTNAQPQFMNRTEEHAIAAYRSAAPRPSGAGAAETARRRTTAARAAARPGSDTRLLHAGQVHADPSCRRRVTITANK